jgi:hypothetical protein
MEVAAQNTPPCQTQLAAKKYASKAPTLLEIFLSFFTSSHPPSNNVNLQILL